MAVKTQSLEKKSLDSPDETRDLSGMGKVDVVKIGESKATRSTFKPGWRWSEHVKPIVGGDSCQALHQGVVTAGGIWGPGHAGAEVGLKCGELWVIQPGLHQCVE